MRALILSAAASLALASAQQVNTAAGTSPLEELTRKTYGTEYHMPLVHVVLARIQAETPALMAGRFVSKSGEDLASGYLAGLDTTSAASVEGALLYVQAEAINQNARPATQRCERKNNASYVVLFEILVAQTNETLAQFEEAWPVPEYGPYVQTENGQCSTDSGDACLQLNGDQGQPNVGPFVGAQLVSEHRRAPYPDAYLFSFPHTCPLKPRGEKTDACRASTRKGLCDLGQAPDGVTCTFAYDILGWVPLDDLVGITSLKDGSGTPYTNFTTWCQASESNVEFAGNVTTGKMDKGLDFWTDPLNATHNSERVAKMVGLYQDILSGSFKSSLIPASDLQYFKVIPTEAMLTAGNPPCYKSVRVCNFGSGCARSGRAQICTPCKSGETCPTDARYTLPTLAMGKTADSNAEATSESTNSTNRTREPTTPTPAPQPSSTKSGLSTALLVGGAGVLFVGVAVFVLRCMGCACVGQCRGRQHDKSEPPSLAADETAASVDGAYVDMSTQDKLTLSVGTDAVALHSQKSESAAKQTIADEAGGFPGQLLLAVRLPYEDLQIGDIISQGGFGEVFVATYKNQDVAVKRLLAPRRRNPESLARFVQEIELNATLDHECLARFIGAAWDVRENLCMVSEFVRGGDLRTLLSGYARNGYPNGHDGGKLRTAIQVAQALTYLHSRDPPVVHRDLKSRNVLLTELLDAKLIDLGVATECLDETMTAGVGTSLWMAPEIMLGRRYDEKADVFSFGVILSELDTHETPYDHVRDPESNRKLASALLNQLIYEGKVKPRFTEMADPEIVALAKDCLAVDPSKRPTSSQVLDRIRRSGRQGGRPTPQAEVQSSRSGTQSSLLFETRATTESGSPAS